ncbi:MAG: histidine phosphatase family protein [Parvibaculaceae bacterium]
MLRLMLLRHAKSSWMDTRLADRDRPLNGRGRKSARLVAGYIMDGKLTPDAILVSPAKRAQETLEILVPPLTPARVETVDNLYDFGDGEVLLDVIGTRGKSARSLMLIGHNPAIENLAATLIGGGDKALRADLERKYPTAALAVIDFKGRSWSRLKAGSGTLTAFVKPRALAADD